MLMLCQDLEDPRTCPPAALARVAPFLDVKFRYPNGYVHGYLRRILSPEELPSRRDERRVGTTHRNARCIRRTTPLPCVPPQRLLPAWT